MEIVTTIRGSFLLSALWCFTSVQSIKAAGECPELQGKDEAARLEYLRGDRSKLAPKCIVAAMKYVGGKKYAPAGPVLIEYLDYHDPGPMPSWSSIPAAYPAVDALFSMGKLVTPELIAVLAGPDASDLVRRNAAHAILMIYTSNRPEGVAALVHAAHAQNDPAVSIRLIDQAKWLSTFCRLETRKACDDAIYKEY